MERCSYGVCNLLFLLIPSLHPSSFQRKWLKGIIDQLGNFTYEEYDMKLEVQKFLCEGEKCACAVRDLHNLIMAVVFGLGLVIFCEFETIYLWIMWDLTCAIQSTDGRTCTSTVAILTNKHCFGAWKMCYYPNFCHHTGELFLFWASRTNKKLDPFIPNSSQINPKFWCHIPFPPWPV